MSRPERGAYGNARGKERQKRRREARLADPRVASALAEVRDHQEKIDAAIEAGHVGSGRPKLIYSKQMSETEVARVKEAVTKAGPAVVLPTHVQVEFSVTWNIRDVYLMIHQEYSLRYIAKRTGYDYDLVVDMLCDLSEEEDEELEESGDDGTE